MFNKRLGLRLIIRLNNIEWYSCWAGTTCIMFWGIAILLDSKNVASDYSVLGVIVITHIPALAEWWYSNRNLKRLRKQIACDIPIGMIKKQDRKPFGRYGDAIRITILIISSTTISISKLIKADALVSEYIFVLAPALVMILFIWRHEYTIWPITN